MDYDFKELTVKQLLQKYKRLSRNAPMIYETDEVLDKYYSELIAIEREIISRTNETTN